MFYSILRNGGQKKYPRTSSYNNNSPVQEMCKDDNYLILDILYIYNTVLFSWHSSKYIGAT